MRGIQSTTVRHILKCDKDAPIEEQTVWHIKLLNALDQSASLRRSAKAFKSTYKGDTEVDEKKHRDSLRGNFRDVVLKVENFMYGEANNEELSKEGFIKEITDPSMLERIIYDIQPAHMQEIWDVANGDIAVEVPEADPKK